MPTDIENRFVEACDRAWMTIRIVDSLPPDQRADELAMVSRDMRAIDNASRELYELEQQADRGEIPALPSGVYNEKFKVYGLLVDAHDRFCRRVRLYREDLDNVALRADLALVRDAATAHYGAV